MISILGPRSWSLRSWGSGTRQTMPNKVSPILTAKQEIAFKGSKVYNPQEKISGRVNKIDNFQAGKEQMLTGFSMKNGWGSKTEIFGRVELNIAGPATFKVFFHRASVKCRRAVFGRVCYTGVFFSITSLKLKQMLALRLLI